LDRRRPVTDRRRADADTDEDNIPSRAYPHPIGTAAQREQRYASNIRPDANAGSIRTSEATAEPDPD
jgi:hypothetical protein